MKFKDNLAIVTGGCTGIGKEIAIGLAKEGAKVVVVSRNQRNLDRVVEEIRIMNGYAISITKDLTKEKEVKELVDEVINQFGKIDILINNAGGYPSEMYEERTRNPLKIWDWTEEQWDIIINSNLKTTFLCCSKVLPSMIEQKRGYIINMASRMGRIASEMTAYAAAKSGVISLTKTIALQAGGYGVICNAILPGVIDTQSQRKYNHSVNNQVLMGDLDPIIKSVLFLLCDAPSQMNGQSLDLFQTN